MKLHILLVMTLLVAACAVAAPAAPPATAPAGPEPEYSAIYVQGRKIGHAVSSRLVADGNVTTGNLISLTLGRGAVSMSLAVTETDVETPDGKPRAFRSAIDGMSSVATVNEGVIDSNGLLHVTVTTGGAPRKTVEPWPPGALLSEGQRLLAVARGFKEGTAYSAWVFDTTSLKAIHADFRVGPKEKVDLLGRSTLLTKVDFNLQGILGKMTSTLYVDDQCNQLKSVVPMMGMTLEIVSCDKAFALSPNDVMDFFDRFLLRSPQPLANLSQAKSISYKLTPSAGAKLLVPASDEQAVLVNPDGSVTVTVTPFAPPAGAAMPYKGADPDVLAALKPTRYIQSDDKLIIDLARQAAGDAKDAASAVRRIEGFVHQYITKKDLSVGYGSAAEVAQTREGDCTEHAVLAAALCRAAGIPAQAVYGVAYVQRFGASTDIFGPHAWVRAFIGGKWVSLDAALNGFDAGHILLAVDKDGPASFFDMVNTLGNFQITAADVQK